MDWEKLSRKHDPTLKKLVIPDGVYLAKFKKLNAFYSKSEGELFIKFSFEILEDEKGGDEFSGEELQILKNFRNEISINSICEFFEAFGYPITDWEKFGAFLELPEEEINVDAIQSFNEEMAGEKFYLAKETSKTGWVNFAIAVLPEEKKGEKNDDLPF